MLFRSGGSEGANWAGLDRAGLKDVPERGLWRDAQRDAPRDAESLPPFGHFWARPATFLSFFSGPYCGILLFPGSDF